VVLVEKVSFKQLLRGRVLKMNFIFFNCFCIFPFLIIYMILIKVFIILIWGVWCLYSEIIKSFPVETVEPWMSFHFIVSIHTQATGCLTCKTLQNKTLSQIYYKLTLFMKSAASSDQPSGTSFFLIYACLARIWSLISLLLLP